MSLLQQYGAASGLLWSVSPIVDIGRDGWPEKLHVQAIAALQSWSDGDGEETPARKERERNWCRAINGACTDTKTLPHERRVLRQQTIVSGGEVVGTATDWTCFITAQDFSVWLAVNGETPGPLALLWFKAQGIPAPAATRRNAIHAPDVERLLPMLPLQQKMSARTAAEILGGGAHRLGDIMLMVADGEIVSWTHSPTKNEPARYIDHKWGTETILPRITPDTSPDSVMVAGDDVLWLWCVQFEQLLHGAERPPKEAVEARLKYIYAQGRPLVPTVPEPQAVPAPVAAESGNSALVVPFNKSALIAAHIHEWPTIERDIADAHINGLAAAAKAGKRGWREVEALNWAKAKGKLVSAAKPAESLAQAMHSMSILPSRKHTLQG